MAAITCYASPSEAADPAWAAVYSPDLPTYVRQLRAEGFPEEVVGLLVSHELNLQFRERERGLQPDVLTPEGLRAFWSLERRAESRLVRLEKQMLARAVLETAPGVTAEADWFATHLAGLRPRHRDMVRAIAADYDDLIQRIRAASHGFLTTEDRDAIVFLESERAHDLKEFLNAAQLLDFEIEHSAAGRLVLEDLFCFEPTPAELRDYHAAMVEQGIERVALEMDSPDATRRRVEARRETVARLAEVWPADRFARLRFCLGHPYRKIYPLTHRLGRTTADADAVLAAFAQLMDAIEAMGQRRPHPMDTPQRRAEIIGHYERHCAAVRAILGDDGFEQYHALFSEVFTWHAAGQMHWMPINFTPR